MKVDLWLLSASSVLIIFGWLAILTKGSTFFARQVLFSLIGLVCMFALMSINCRLLGQYAWWIYGLSILALVLVLIFGRSLHGSRSWFMLGSFTLQPSEFAKVALIIALSRYVDRRLTREDSLEIPALFVPFLVTLLPMALVMLQPDLGSAIIFLPVFLGVMYLGGMKMIHLVSILSFAAIVLGIPLFMTFMTEVKTPHSAFAQFIYAVLKHPPYTVIAMVGAILFVGAVYYVLTELRFRLPPVYFYTASAVICGGLLCSYPLQTFLKTYQKKRLIAFVSPNIDPLGTGYHIIQSKIAIGSGGLLGKGFLKGTQGNLGFLPVQHADFIFSVLAEETGFIGGVVVLALLLIILIRGISIATTSSSRFGSLLSGGIVTFLFVEVVMNIGMTMGIMPIVGVSLPLVSYGGSSLVSSMMCIGILLGIYYRRFTY